MSRKTVLTIAIAGVALAGAVAAWRPLSKLAGLGQSIPAFASPSDGVYALELDMAVQQTGGPPLLTLAISGPLVLQVQSVGIPRVLRADFLGSIAGAKGLGPGVGAGPQDGAEVPAALNAALGVPFFLEFGKNGEFLGTRLTGQVPPFVGTLWQFLGASLQFVGKAAADHWESEENDSVGHYVADYRLTGRRTAEKRKRAYRSYVSKNVPYATVESLGQFSFADDWTLESMTTRDRTETQATGAVGGFVSTTSVTVKRSTDQNVPAGRELRPYSEYEAVAPEREVAISTDDSFNDQMIGGRKLSDLFAELAIGAGTDKDTKAERERQGRAYVALAAYIRKNPQDLKTVANEIINNRDLAVALISALRDAGTREAQQTMRDLLSEKERLSYRMRGLLVQGLSLVSTPSPETVAKLTELQSDSQFKTQATYGLGSNAHRLAESNPELSKAIVDGLVDRLRNATSDGARTTLLTALGAAGNPSALAAISPYTTNPDEGVRAGSAQALRRIAGREADTMLAALATDPSADVRLAAIDSISERPPSASLEKVVSQMALADTRERAKYNAVKVLGQWLAGGDQGLRGILEQVQTQPNLDPQLARLASQILGGPAPKK